MNIKGYSYDDFENNMKSFAHRVSGVESEYGRNLKELGGTTTAKGMYQFTDESVGTAKQRLKNLKVNDSIIQNISDNPLDWSKEQSDLMFFGNIFAADESDPYLKAIGGGDKEQMKEAYYKYHHTSPDEATKQRAVQYFK